MENSAIASLIIGAFVVKVATAGNAKRMSELAVEEKGFVKWFLALAVLMYIKNVPALSKIGGELVFMALLGFTITALPNLQSEIKTFWSNL